MNSMLSPFITNDDYSIIIKNFEYLADLDYDYISQMDKLLSPLNDYFFNISNNA